MKPSFLRLVSLLIVAASGPWSSLHAQEVVFPLGGNAVLQEIARSIVRDQASLRITAADTLDLPFQDDFSLPGVFPNATLWSDSGAFINTTFCENPVSIGTATFDGLAWNGVPYDTVSGFTRICDYLTSQPIHNDYQASDSVYLSFFYQPQGFGEQPDSTSLNGIGDSLVLQFRNSNGAWEHAWSRNGFSNAPFQSVYIRIDTAYLYDGFQFRFLNYATPNGNRDHWNLDYVRLDRNRTYNDLIPDVTELYPQGSWLKEYSAMPYPHYKSLANPTVWMKDSLVDTVSNIDYTSTSINHTFECIDPSQNSIYNQTKSVQAFTATRFSVTDPLATNFQFPSLAGDSARFLLRAYKSITGNYNVENDTATSTQCFYNYYSYDDGTAEGAYGINQANARLAYRFNNLLEDTLVGVQMYFNPVGDAVHNKLFQLCYWQSIAFGGGTENLVYKRINMKPANRDSINGFVTYEFDSTLVVPAGEFYVGWIQNDATLLGLGVDVNTVDTLNKFYFYAGGWQRSAIRGAWMLRPVFGKQLPTATSELNASKFSFSVFPNPSDGRIRYTLDGQQNRMYDYTLTDMAGRTVATGNLAGGTLDLSFLPRGVYILKAINRKDRSSVQTKVVITR